MYREWARKRRMRCETLSDRLPQGPAVLAMSGFGAHAILARETGIHVFEIPDTSGSFVRCSVRVRVAPQPLIQPRGDQDALQRAWAVLEAGNAPGHTIVRRYRRQPSPLVRDALAGWRTGKLEQVLRGDFDLMTHEQI
jgi:ATP-dependent Clp protease ATP-binding subunit ClpC